MLEPGRPIHKAMRMNLGPQDSPLWFSNVRVGIPFPSWCQGYFSQVTVSRPLPPGDTQRHVTGSFFLPAALYEELSSPSHPIDHPSESAWNHPGCAQGRSDRHTGWGLRVPSAFGLLWSCWKGLCVLWLSHGTWCLVCTQDKISFACL